MKLCHKSKCNQLELLVTNSPFFTQLHPQSEYRRGKKKESGARSAALITGLSALSGIDSTTQINLKTRIETEIDLIFDTLLPDFCWDPKEKEAINLDILDSLGLKQ